MGVWLLSIAGVITLSVLVDILLPEGQTNKYIKGIFSVITLFVIIAPLPDALSKKVDWSKSLNFEAVEIKLDENYLQGLSDNPFELKEKALLSYLKDEGYPVKSVKIVEKINLIGKIDYINVILASSELPTDVSHNIISNEVKTLTSEFCGVEKEGVRVLYER